MTPYLPKSFMFRQLKYLIIFTAFFTQSLISYEIAIASMFRNCAPYIREWVAYHHMIGVDHFWLYNDSSTDNWADELKDFIDQGIVDVFYWPADKPDWTGQQIAAFRDGLKRGLGTTKWIALLDQDEFILPMKNRSLVECLNLYFKKVGAVYVNWRHFGTSHINLAFGQPMLTNLLSCSHRKHSANSSGKSIIRPECADIDYLWTQHFCPLKSGFKYVNGDRTSTIVFVGPDLRTDGRNHDEYIRINHYAHRDENYFFNYRLPRDSNPSLMMEHYKSFNITTDNTIVKFIKKNYPDMFLNFWKKN